MDSIKDLRSTEEDKNQIAFVVLERNDNKDKPNNTYRLDNEVMGYVDMIKRLKNQKHLLIISVTRRKSRWFKIGL